MLGVKFPLCTITNNSCGMEGWDIRSKSVTLEDLCPFFICITCSVSCGGHFLAKIFVGGANRSWNWYCASAGYRYLFFFFFFQKEVAL